MIKKANMKEAANKAHKIARWAKIMTKVALRFASRGSKKWQIVSFEGPAGSESRGVVDFLAIRRDHKLTKRPFKPGDLFEIVFIQAKGGNAGMPTENDEKRLLNVGDYYHAKHIILAEWKPGKLPIFKKLLKNSQWKEINAESIFK